MTHRPSLCDSDLRDDSPVRRGLAALLLRGGRLTKLFNKVASCAPALAGLALLALTADPAFSQSFFNNKPNCSQSGNTFTCKAAVSFKPLYHGDRDRVRVPKHGRYGVRLTVWFQDDGQLDGNWRDNIVAWGTLAFFAEGKGFDIRDEHSNRNLNIRSNSSSGNAGRYSSAMWIDSDAGDSLIMNWSRDHRVSGVTIGLLADAQGELKVGNNGTFFGRFGGNGEGINARSHWNKVGIKVRHVAGHGKGIVADAGGDGTNGGVTVEVSNGAYGVKNHGVHAESRGPHDIVVKGGYFSAGGKPTTLRRRSGRNTNQAAVYARSHGTGDIFVSGSRIGSVHRGIHAKGRGSLTVDFTGNIDAQGRVIEFVTTDNNTDAYLKLNADRVKVTHNDAQPAILLKSEKRNLKLVSTARTDIEGAREGGVEATANGSIFMDVKGPVTATPHKVAQGKVSRAGVLVLSTGTAQGSVNSTVNVTVATVTVNATSNANASAVRITNNGTGATTFTATGKLKATGQADGIHIPGHSNNTTMTLNFGEVEAQRWAVRVDHKGSGNVNITANSQRNSGKISSTGNGANDGHNAVIFVNHDTNATSHAILSLKAVENAAGKGAAIRIDQKAKGDISLRATSVTRRGSGGANALEVIRPVSSTGTTGIVVSGAVDATAGGGGGDAINVVDPNGVSDSSGRLDINVGGATGGWMGMRIVHRRGGRVSIISTGAVVSKSTGTFADPALFLENHHTGTAPIFISVAAATASDQNAAAIKVDQRGSGNITIRATGAVTRKGSGNEAAVLIQRATGSRGNVDMRFTDTIDATAGGGRGDAIKLQDPSGTSDSTGTLFISVATATGGWMGMRLTHRRGGDVTINATGAVTSKNTDANSEDPAILLENYGADSNIDMSLAAVTGSAGKAPAIKVVQHGAGDIDISGSGAIQRTGAGNAHAVFVERRGAGNVSLSFTGAINSNAGGGGGDAINMESGVAGAEGNLFISVATATGGWAGVRVKHKRGGDVTINVTGNVTSKGGGGSDNAISLINDDHDSAININVGTQSSVGPTIHAQGTQDADGIHVIQEHNGNVTIEAHSQTTVRPRIKTAGRHGVYVKNQGTGDVTITASKLVQIGNNFVTRDATIEGASRGAGVKVEAQSSSGPVAVTVATVTSSGHGLNIVNQGSGATTITATNTISASRDGIRVDRNANSNSGANLRVRAGAVSGGWMGMRITHRGAGALSIDATGPVISTQTDAQSGDSAISASNHGGGDANITLATVTASAGRANAIYVAQHNSGNVHVRVSRAVTRTGAGAGNAVKVRHNSSGNRATLTISGAVTSTDGGVYLKNDAAAANLQLSVATVTAAGTHSSGGSDAIRVIQEHGGTVEVSASGAVSTSGRHGVFVTQQGSGNVSVNLAGNVTGGSHAADSAVKVEAGAGVRVALTLSGAVGGADSNAVVETGGSATVDVTSGGEVKGHVDLGAGDDTLRLVQASAMQAGDWAGGAGDDELVFDRSNGALDSATGWEEIEIGAGSSIHLHTTGTNTLTTDTLTVTGTLTIGTGANDRDTDATLRLAGDLAGGGTVAINANFVDPINANFDGGGHDTLEVHGNITGDASLVVSGKTQLGAGKFHFDRPLRFNRVVRVTGRGELNTSSIDFGAVGYRLQADPADVEAGWFDLVRYYTNWCRPVSGTPGAFLCSGATLIGGPQSLSASGDVTLDVTLASETGVHAKGTAFSLEQTTGTGGIILTQSAFGNSISGTVDGVVAAVNRGAVSINLTGLADGQSGYGVKVAGTSDGAGISITAADVSGVRAGVKVVSSGGEGGIRIKTTGAVEATGSGQNGEAGIVAQGTGTTGAMTIDVATVTGSLTGILATQRSANPLSIIATQNVTGKGGSIHSAIDARTSSGGDLRIDVAGVTALGALTTGIKAVSAGSGDLTITATGLVSSEQGVGVDARIQGSGDLRIAAATVTGSSFGIKAEGASAGGQTGAISIMATGAVSGSTAGVSASAQSGDDMTISVATVSGGTGIKAVQENAAGASGGIDVTATGSATGSAAGGFGIEAEVERGAGAVSVAAGSASGGAAGIRAAAGGTGAVTVRATGLVTATTTSGIGIDVSASGGAVTVSAAAVTGSVIGAGIKIQARGAGAVSVSASGAVAGGARSHGIHVDHDGSGPTRIAVSNSVTGGQNWSAIRTDDLAGSRVTLALGSGASVGTGTRNAIFGSAGNTEVTVDSGGAILGSVTLGAGNDALTFAGGSFESVTGMDGGTGVDTLTFSNGASGTLHADVMSGGLEGWENVFVTGGASISSVKLAGDSDNLTFDGADIRGIGTLTADGGNSDNTLTFKDLSGTLADATLTGWEEVSIGAGATIKFGDGQHAFAQDVSVAANGTLDVGDDTDASDVLTVSGDFEGGGVVALNANFLPNAGAADKLKITGNVSGSTIVRLRAVPGALVGNQTDEDRPLTISGVIEVTGSVDPGAFFAAGDIVFGNVGYVLVPDGQNAKIFNLRREFTNNCRREGDENSGVYTCSGSGPIGDSQTLEARDRELRVTLHAETPTLTLGDNGGTSFALGQTGTGGIRFTQSANGKWIRGSESGIDADNRGDGAISINVNAAVTAAGGDGVKANNTGAAGGEISITTGPVSGSDSGIKVAQSGSAAVKISASGAVTGTSEEGIYALAKDSGGPISVTAAAVSGGKFGIWVASSGTLAGAISVRATGAVTGSGTGTGTAGIHAVGSARTTDVTINAVAVSGGSGISATNSGTGKLDINATGAVSGTGTAGRGIRGEISSASGAGLTITAANAVSGSRYGVEVRSSGSGAVSVAVSGAVTASGGKGIFVNAGSTAGTLTIAAATVTGTSRGIEAFGPKAVSIGASGPVSAGGSLGRGIYGTSTGGPVAVTAAQVTGAGYGIVARSTGAGVTIRATGTVTGTAKKGILADTSVAASYASKAIAITVARVVGNEAGIEARQRSAGDLTISAAGAVYGAAGTGVDAVAESRAGALTVSVADKVTGSSYGIKAVSSGSGAVDVQVGGAVTASAGMGIHGSAGPNAATLTITAAAVTGATIGIKAIGSGSGGISVKATGAVVGTSTAGIQATGGATAGAMKIDVAAVTGKLGIEARQASANRLGIKVSGSVSGTGTGATDAGIYALASSDAAISIDAATVTGGRSGIRTVSSGAGPVSIRATGAVVGSSLRGIHATASSGAAITITAADVSGASQGVYARTQGTISIATSGTVTGNSNNGIYAYQTGTGSTRVTVFGSVSTPSSDAAHAAIKTTGSNSANEYRPVAIALERGAVVSGTTAILDALLGNATVTVKPGAAVQGKIDLGPGNDVLHFAGGTFSGVGEMQGGAGNDTLRFSGGSGALHSTVQVQGLKGWESVIVEKGAALSGTIRLANDSNNLTLDGVDISSIGTLTADGSNSGNTLSFRGKEVSGSLAAKTVTGWENISIGAGANIKFADGTVNRTFNLSLAAGGTLDLGSDTDVSDALLLTGNFAGGGTITLNANFTGAGTSDQLYVLGSSNQVTGITSIEVNPVGQLGANETDADRPQRIAGVITVAGTVQAGAFTSVSVSFDEVGYRLEVNPNDSKVFDLVQFPTNDCKTGAVASEGSVSFLPVVCEGSQIGSPQSLGASGNTELRVTLNTRTAVNAGATAFLLEQSGGNRGLSFTQSATGKQITAGQTAIDATNSGGGAISINVNGPVTGVRGDGIRAQNDASGFGIMITAASVVAGSFGIAVFSSGAGTASVKAAGAVSGGRAGVKASVGGALTLDLASVTGGVGIDASSSGGNVTVSAGDVTGTNGGIKVSATGTNNVMIIPSGDVAGGSGDGIYVGHDGNGSTTITVSKAVTGGAASTVAAIRTARTAGNLDIRLHSGASVGAGARNAITGGAGNSTVTVNTGATVAGRISLGGGNDHLEFRGGSFGAVTEMDGGGGSNDVLVFSNDATGRLSTTLATNGLKGWESVEVKNGATLSGTIRLAASSDNLTFDRASIANIGTLAASGNNSSNRLAFRNNVSGSLNAENVTGWEEINVGRRARINFGSGARTLTVGTLKVDPGGTLDVGDDSDTGDTLTVSGNFEGGGVIALDANFAPNSRGSDKLVITGSVSGATTVNISSLGAPNIAGSIAHTDHIYDVITVEGTISAGASSFTGYSLFGAHGYRLRPQPGSRGVFYLQAFTTNTCKSEGTPGAYVCDGTNQIGAASSFSSSATHMVKVTVHSETPVDTDGTAFTLTQTTTSGITFTQSASGQSIVGEESVIVASNSGGGAISINVTGTVTGLSGDGIRAANDASGAGITITAASVQGANSGIEAEERGRGAVKIVATGTVTGVAEEGVYAKTADSGGAITVTAASVSGGKVGIKVSASGQAAVSVKATGAVTGAATAGIHLVGGARTTSAVIDAAAVTGKSGIDARHGGSGKLDVRATGAVMGTGTGGVGIYGLVSSGSRGALTITATSDVTGSATGIRAVGSGSGAVSVSAAGDVTGTGTGGIGVDAAANASAGALTINVATVTGSVAGIKAVGRSRNVVNVSASGPVAATGAPSGTGIDALATSGGNLTITAAAVTGSAIGIKAVSRGAGAVRVKATGVVTGTGTAGIQASGGGSAAGLMVDAATVTGSAGIDAQHAGSGELKIKASDMVTGSTGTGISGLASGNARLSITAAAVTGGTTGIKAVGRGAGAVAVKATGAVMGTGAGGVGIDAMASGGNVAVSAATVTGTAAGIKAVVTGNGGVSISASGAVTGAGAGAAGIDAMASGGNVTVSAAAVTGLVTGIKAVSAGNGTVSISASGAVAGSNGDGILVERSGSGATTITVSAAVTGSSGSGFAAIRTEAARGGGVTITLNRGASVGSSGRNAIKGGAGNSAVTANYGATVTGTVALGAGSDTLILNRGATVSGAIDMGAGNDSLTFAGGTFASVTEIKGGEGTDTLTFSGGSGPLNSTVQTQGLKGWESIVVRSGATITGGVKLAGDSDSLTLDDVNIASIGELNGGGGADSTLALNNVSGALDASNVVGWGKVDIGGNSSISLHNSLSVAGTLSLAEGATLDATGATNGRANDVLTLNGDFSGGGVITLNVDFLSVGNTSADHVVITGNVTGTTTIKLERLGSGPILASSPPRDKLPVIKVQGVASASAFVLDALVDTGETYTYRLVKGSGGDNTFSLNRISANKCRETITGSGEFVCSGANDIGTDQSLGATDGTPLQVTLNSETLVQTGGAAFTLTQSGGAGGIEFTQSANGKAVTGVTSGIRATNKNGGAISISVNGAVTGGSEYGIRAENDASGAGIAITAAAVTGGSAAIMASASGSGAVSVKATGTVNGTSGEGIDARTGNGNLTVAAATATGRDAGIKATASGSGSVSISASGMVTGTGANGSGIDASASGGNVTVSAATVTGGATGIKVRASGSGSVSISASGTVTGTGSDGIFVDHDGAGTTIITVTTAVGGGAGANNAAIRTDVSSGGATIALNSGASVGSGGRNAIMGGGGSAAVTVNTGAAINGKIRLGGGADTLTFAGGTFSNVVDMDGGAGNDTLTFSGGSGSLHGTVQSEGLKGWETVVVGSGAELSGAIKLDRTSRKLKIDSTKLNDLGALTGGGAGTTLELSAVSGEIKSAVTGWGTVAVESGSSISFGTRSVTASALTVAENATLKVSGSTTLTANTTVAAGGTIDLAGDDNSVNDTLTVSGNLSGGGTIVLNAQFSPSSANSDQLVIRGTVSGTPTVSFKKIGDVNPANAPVEIKNVITVESNGANVSGSAFKIGGDFDFGPITYVLKSEPRTSANAPYVFKLERIYSNECERVEGALGEYFCSGEFLIGETQNLPANGSGALGSSALVVSLASQTPVNVSSGGAFRLRHTGRAGIAFQQQVGGEEIKAAGDGFNAVNAGGGSVAIVATGSITAGNDGVSVSNDSRGFGVRVAVATVDAGNDGVSVSNSGAGGVEVSATGAITAKGDGVSATGGVNGLGVYVSVATVTAEAGHGVSVDSDGAGSVSVRAESAKGGDAGIRVRTGSRGTNMVIAAGSVEGDSAGISVEHRGRGLARITTSGRVTGTGDGIDARVGRNGSLAIYASGAVTGTRGDGIRARSDAAAPISISVSSKVTGGRFSGKAAISTDSDGGKTTILLESGASVGATGRGTAIIDGGSEATVTLQAGASIIGDVKLGGGADELILAGGDFTKITAIDGGAGEDTLRINAGSGRLSALSDGSGAKSIERIIVSASADLGGDIRVGAQTRELVFVDSDNFVTERQFDDDAKLVGDGEARLAFRNVTGDLDLSRLSNWGTLEIGAGSSMKIEGATLEKDAAGGIVLLGGMQFGSSSRTDDTFTVEGNFSGEGGFVNVDANLATGQSDRLVVEGDVSGTTHIAFSNNASSSDQPKNGDLEVVTVGGKAEPEAFSLKGGSVPAGAFSYDLQFVSDGNKFVLRPGERVSDAGAALRTAPAALADGFAKATTLAQRTAARAPTAVIGAGIGSAATYSERSAELAAQGAADLSALPGRSVWLRIYGDKREYGADAVSGETEISSTGLQFGLDLLSMELDSGKWIAGLSAQYGTVKAETSGSGGVGTQDSSGYGLGATFSWFAYSGFYADAQAQFGTVDSDYASSSMSAIKSGVSAGVSLTSLEVGWRIAAGETTMIVPQAQISAGSVKSDGFTADSLRVESATATTVDGRLGLAAEFPIPNGAVRVSSSLSRTLSEPDGTVINDKTIEQDLPNGWMEFGVGASQDLSEDAVLFLDGTWRTGVGGADSTGTSISGGLKISW